MPHNDPPSCPGCSICRPGAPSPSAALDPSDRATLQAARAILDGRADHCASQATLNPGQEARARGRAWHASAASTLIGTLLFLEGEPLPAAPSAGRLSDLAEAERVDGPPVVVALRRRLASLEEENRRLRALVLSSSPTLNPRPEP